MKKQIAVIDGGFSEEAQISFKSADAVLTNLDTDRFIAHRIRIVDERWIYDPLGLKLEVNKNDFSVELNGEKLRFDCAMILIHGTPGEDGKLQAYFDLLGLPYTTCDHSSSTLTFNKYLCNRVLESYGFKCAKGVLLRKTTDWTASGIVDDLGLPCFVKPNDGGSSFGATRVTEESQLEKAIRDAFDHGKDVIIEEFMEGPEVTNGVYFNGSEVKSLPITEIITENDFFDFNAKYKGESSEITPARISQDLTDEIKDISERIYKSLGLAGVCRIDYIIKEGVPHVIEINTVPGQSTESIVPKMAAIEGVSLTDLFSCLIDQAI